MKEIALQISLLPKTMTLEKYSISAQLDISISLNRMFLRKIGRFHPHHGSQWLRSKVVEICHYGSKKRLFYCFYRTWMRFEFIIGECFVGGDFCWWSYCEIFSIHTETRSGSFSWGIKKFAWIFIAFIYHDYNIK